MIVQCCSHQSYISQSITKDAYYIALYTAISLCSLFRTVVAGHGSHVYWPAFPEGSLRIITPHTPELSAVNFLPCLPRISEELDLQKPELLASSSGQLRAPLHRLYISSSPLGVADSLQPHTVCHFMLFPFLLYPTQAATTAQSCPKSWNHLVSSAAPFTLLSQFLAISELVPQHQYLDANWNSSASAAGEPSYIQMV